MVDLGDMLKQALGGQDLNVTLEAMKAVAQDEAQELRAEQLTSKSAFLNETQEMVNPFAARQATKKPKTIENRSASVMKMLKMSDKPEQLSAIKQSKDTADQFQRRNPELKSGILIILKDYIKPGDSKEEILKKLQEFYQDVSLADEALDFLIETSEGELLNTCKEAKEEFNKMHEREIIAGRNIGNVARDAAQKGLGTATSLRDMYRDITGNPRDSTTLFEELNAKYAYKDLKKVVDFMLHSLGADMKSKGPSISHAFLQRLFTETRSMQAILGVYGFFRGRMKLLNTMFQKGGLTIPETLTYESIAKQFMALCADRYPTGEKALQTAVKLGIEKWVQAKIAVLTQMRDAIREVALNQVFKTLQHRDEVYLALLEALEDLEDELDELLEREDEEGEEEET